MTFTDEQQQLHRDLFIKECRQKAWGASCHADWISKGLDKILAEYEKLQADDRALEEEIKTLGLALDSHTKDNRLKRNGLQGRRTALFTAMLNLSKNMQQGQQALNGLNQSAEASLELAEHAIGCNMRDS